MKTFQRFLIAIGILLAIPTVVLGAQSVFQSNQVGSSATANYVLQTNGTNSTWVATSTLGFSGGSSVYARAVTKTVCASNAIDITNCDYKASGTADQTIINTAITAIASSTPGTGTVQLSEGTFNITGPIAVLSTGIGIRGEGMFATTINISNSFNDYAIKIPGTTNVFGLLFQDFGINGNISNQTSGGCIMASSTARSTFERLQLNGCFNQGIKFAGQNDGTFAYNNTIDNNYIVNDQIGLQFFQNDENNIYGNVINTFSVAGIDDQVGLQNIQHNTFTGVTATTGIGVHIDNTNKDVVNNNVFDGSPDEAIKVDGGYSTISNNVITLPANGNNGKAAIQVNTGSNNVITGNVVDGNGHATYDYAESNSPTNDIVLGNNWGGGSIANTNFGGGATTTSFFNSGTSTPSNSIYWGQVDKANNLGFNVPSSRNYYFGVNGSTVALINSTSLTVTGSTTITGPLLVSSMATSTINTQLNVTSTGSNPSIYNPTAGNGIILRAIGAGSTYGQLRIVENNNGWTDGVDTTYFQASNNVSNNLTFLNGTYGNDTAFNRFQLDASSTQFTDQFYTATQIPYSLFGIVNSTAAKIGLTIQGASAQTADLFQVRNSSGSIIDRITSSGIASSSDIYDSFLGGNLAGTFIAADASGHLIATTTPSSGVTSVATNNGLTGGTITTTGTIGLNTTGLSTNALVTWNGSNLVATGTPILTVGSITATTTATSTFAGGINLTSGCLQIGASCIGAMSGTVTSITAGTGLTGGAITTAGTIALDLTRANTWTTVATTTFNGSIAISTTSPTALNIADQYGTNDFTVGTASTTGPILLVQATSSLSTLFQIDQYGHLLASSTPQKVSVSSCGTGSPSLSANSNDVTGDVTTGTLATTCTITFGNAYSATPEVLITGGSAASVTAVTSRSTTGFVIGLGTAATGDNISYFVVMP